MEWVEIIEPRTKERMYANLTSGECVWEPPPGVPVKKTNENQWWELFDPNTSRFYYYSASSQKTVWHKPSNCDIIPLAKLQTLKQNTEPKDAGSGGSLGSARLSDQSRSSRKESVATQTPSRTGVEKKSRSSRESVSCESSTRSIGSYNRVISSIETQTSPVSSPHLSRRHHHHHHRDGSGECQVVESRPRSSRRGCPSAGWHKRVGTQDSGRSSDSGSISMSRTSLEAGLMSKLDSPRRNTRESQDFKYPSLEPSVTRKYREGSLKSLDKVTSPSKSDSLKNSRQLSLDAERHRLFDYYHERPKEGSLSRSLSFMQQRVEEDKGGPMSTPQPRRKLQSSGSGDVKNDSLDSLCTPMIHRKNRSAETGKMREFGNRKLLDKLRDLSGSFHSDSSPSPSSPKCEFSSPFSTHDSGNSTLNEKDALMLLRGRCSADSSPHSQGDSGLATTGSRASQDSNPNTKSLSSTRSSDKFDTSRSFESMRGSDGGAKGEKHSSDSTSESTAKNSSPSTNVDAASPMYGNLDVFKYASEDRTESHLLPLQQYILEQAKLSGYRLADPLQEEVDSLHSEDEEAEESNGRDSDAFADDEGLSNPDSASSHDELDGAGYLKEDDHYRQFVGAHSSQSSRSHYRSTNGQEPIKEPEYVEAEYGSIYGALFGIGSVRPTGLSLSHTVSHHVPELIPGSLRRRKDPSPSSQPNLYSPVMERRDPFRDGCSTHSFRPMSISTITAASSPSPQMHSAHTQIRFQMMLQAPSLHRERCALPTLPPPMIGPANAGGGDIEKYAADHLAVHKKGLFRKNVSVRDMLSWSKDGLNKPMLPFVDKLLKKDSCNLFRLVQIYMGDRKCKPDMTCNGVALDLCNMGWNKPVLRDELYLDLCKQTTENPRKESLRRGWELIAICLHFFPPSPKLQPHLEGYIKRHRDPSLHFSEIGKWPIHVQVSHYATISSKRLERIGKGGRRPARKPSFEEIEQARLQIFRPSMFGNTLEEIMTVQRERFPHRKLPWIQTTLSEEVLRLQGASTEGIFRVPADIDEVNTLKSKLDQWELGAVSDAHVPASLLKLWYRELYEPLIPDHLYEDCVRHCTDPDTCVSIVHRLPEQNKLVLCYLIRFLQIFSQLEVVATTKMDAGNLSMVMAPNCLRCTATDPRVIFENTRKEMAFLRTLIQNLDTGFMEGVV